MGLVSRRNAVLLSSAALMMVVGSTHGLAQDVNEDDKQGRVTLLQRLVVGAGADKIAIDTPQSVTVVQQEDIDREQAVTIGEVLRRMPGVNTSGSDRVFGQTFNIRGIGAPEAANEEGRIIVNVDGVNKFYEQYSMGGFFSDPELYKRVEVLRGPASSTLYGSGALGGVINFETKDAADFIAPGQSGAFRLKGGFNSNRNGWLGSAVFAQRITEDFDFLLAGNYRMSDAYRSGDGTEITGTDFSAWSGLAKGTIRVGDEGTLRASYQQWDSDASDQDFSQVGGTVSGNVDRHVIDRTAIISYENPVSDNDLLDFRISGSFSDTIVNQENAIGTAPVPGIPPIMCPDTGQSQAIIFCDSRFSYQTWQLNAENTSRWQGEDWQNYLTYGWQSSYQTRSADGFRDNGDPIAFPFHPEGTDFKTGVFVQNEFIWDDRLTLIPGMRVDWRRLSPDRSTGLAEAVEDWAYSPKLAAHYKVNDNFAVFGSVAHTQRFPVLDEIYSTVVGRDVSVAPSFDLRKERSNNYEAGFAVQAYDIAQPGDALQFKATGFYNDISDLIVSCAANPSPCVTGYQNIEDAHIYGAELEVAYDSDYIFASAAYTHIIGKNRSTGEPLATVAPHELALTVGARVPDYDLSFGWRSRFVASPQNREWRSSEADWQASSRRFAKSFDVHDIFISWAPQDGQFHGWEAQLAVENIFDKQYKEFLHNDAARGRTYKFALSKQLGW